VSAAITLEMDQQICRGAHVVAGQRRSDSVASAKPPKPVKGAHPLAKNKYKVPLTKAVVKRTLLSLIA